MAQKSKKSRTWAASQEAALARKARRSQTVTAFIEEMLRFVVAETKAEKAVLYLFDDAAPPLSAIRARHLDFEVRSELVAIANVGFEDPAQILHRLFLPSHSKTRAAKDLKRELPTFGYASLETIPFMSPDAKIVGVIAIYSTATTESVRRANLGVRPVLNEAAIILDFVVDRFLQQELVQLNQLALQSESFDTQAGMCRLVEAVRKLIGCEGASFFVRDTANDSEVFVLTASTPSRMPVEPIFYTPSDPNLTALALRHKAPSIIHNIADVRKALPDLQKPKWCELPTGRIDKSVLFVPVLRNGNIVALLRCTNKIEAAGESLFNPLDIRRAERFATLVHTWHASIENESRFTSSLIDIAHDLRLSAAGIKARAEFVDLALARNNETALLRRKLSDIQVSMDAILEMMSLLVTVPGHEGERARDDSRPFRPYADLCVPVLKSFGDQISGRLLNIDIPYKYEMGYIYAPIQDFFAILHNLIGNAVKYTHIGGKIVIYLESARQGARYAKISVLSESIHIRPDEREQIFRFRYRAKAARDSDLPGDGRGLAIARGKARRLRGDIIYESIRDMNVFTLLIPKHLFHPAQ